MKKIVKIWLEVFLLTAPVNIIAMMVYALVNHTDIIPKWWAWTNTVIIGGLILVVAIYAVTKMKIIFKDLLP